MVSRIAAALILTCASFHAAQSLQSPNTVVNLSAVALDSHGRPVSDLTAEEFTITDAGKPRNIAFVRHIERRLAAGPALGPNEYSNRRGAGIPHATVILLDLMNQRFDTRALSSNELVHYLQTVEAADYLYLYILTIDGRIFTVRGLPDPERPSPEDGATWTRNIKQTMDSAMRTVLRVRPVDMDVMGRVQLTYSSLESLAARMSIVPGRKNIVWITDGVPLSLGPMRSDTGDFVDFTPLLRRLSTELERSEIAIYPVRQIMIGSADAPPDAPGVPARNGPGSGIQSAETLNQFAAMTGGRPDGGKDIGGALTRAMNDARTSYQIGYYVPEDSLDGKFHKLRIVCRRKGVRIQVRTGYYAWPEEPGNDARQAMRTAFSQSFDAAEIGIRAIVSQSAATARGLHVDTLINARDIALLRGSDRYLGQLSVAVAGYEEGGAAHPSAIHPIPLDYAEKDREKLLTEGIRYSIDVPISANVTSLRFAVFDENSKTLGSVTIPVKDFSKPRH
jgi:VWFA-related protein